MIHYTLNTGHSRFSPRGEVATDIIALCLPWTQTGQHAIPVPKWSLETGRLERGMICTLWRGKIPAVTFAVAATAQYADEVWAEFESFYLSITDTPGHRSSDWSAAKKPESPPWIAVVIVEPFEAAESWIGDFERCIAWAFVESLR